MASLGGIESAVVSASNFTLVKPPQLYDVRAQIIGPPDDPSGLNALMSQFGFSPVPANGFLFDTVQENSLEVNGEITDNYVEDNSARQDQIVLKPIQYTIRGLVGELVDKSPNALNPLRQITDRLALLAPFAPAVSRTAQKAYNTAARVYAAGAVAVSAVNAAKNLISGKSPTTVNLDGSITDFTISKDQTLQAQAFQQFLKWRNARVLFTVQTPWGTFRDMAIMNLRPTQGEDSDMITDFEITFKQLQFAKTNASTIIAMGRAAAQSAKKVNKGISRPVADAALTKTAVDTRFPTPRPTG